MKPDLYMFSISHYCEKARWALDYLGIDYRLRCTVVGAHTRLAKKYGLDSTAVPILVNGDEVIQGSSAIIDWADRHFASVVDCYGLSWPSICPATSIVSSI